jgi:hypothetical protein
LFATAGSILDDYLNDPYHPLRSVALHVSNSNIKIDGRAVTGDELARVLVRSSYYLFDPASDASLAPDFAFVIARLFEKHANLPNNLAAARIARGAAR